MTTNWLIIQGGFWKCASPISKGAIRSRKAFQGGWPGVDVVDKYRWIKNLQYPQKSFFFVEEKPIIGPLYACKTIHRTFMNYSFELYQIYELYI